MTNEIENLFISSSGKCKLEPQFGTTTHPLEGLKLKGRQYQCWQGCRSTGISTADRNVNWYNHTGELFGIGYQSWTCLLCNLAIPVLGLYLRKIYALRNRNKNVDRFTTCNNFTFETTQLPITINQKNKAWYIY